MLPSNLSNGTCPTNATLLNSSSCQEPWSQYVVCADLYAHPADNVYLVPIEIVCGFVSLVFSSFVAFFILLSKQQRSQMIYRLILCISFSNVINSISTLLSINLTEDMCKAQAFLFQLTSIASAMWTMDIAICVFLLVVKNNFEFEKYEGWFHGLSLFFSVASATVPFFFDVYGQVGAWCWIRPYRRGTCDEIGNVLRFVLFYIPIWLFICVIIALYVRVARKIKRTLLSPRGQKDVDAELEKMYTAKAVQGCQAVYSGFGGSAYLVDTCTVPDPAWQDDTDMQRVNGVRRVGRQLFPFPLVLIFIWLPPTINRVLDVIFILDKKKDDMQYESPLYVIQAFTTTLSGLFYSLVYGFNKSARQEMMRSCKRIRHKRVQRQYSMDELSFTAAD